MNRRSAAALLMVACLTGCGGRCSPSSNSSDPDVVLVALPELERPPQPRKNMVWIPAGGFIAGTPVDALPRIADQEMPGAQLVLNGFYIDQFPYPNEPGAIPASNISHAQAEAKCLEAGKRLCSELEWERACKGPKSTAYEYGDVYRRDDCGASATGSLLPTGTRPACRSAFDIHDMHGGAFEWTASPWNRGVESTLVSVRGGAGEPGEVLARCANAVPRRPDRSYADVGFRCCAGDVNDAAVDFEIRRPVESLQALPRSTELIEQLEASLPAKLLELVPATGRGAFHIDRVWNWYPIGNEDLLLASGCAHPDVHSICGVVVYRSRDVAIEPLAFVPSGWWLPNIQLDDDRRLLWVYGGDGVSKFRRRLAYLWGRIGIGEPERGGAQPRRKRSRPM